MKVGLITTDTYRIAATEQLKVYAKIMGLPIDIASEKELFTRTVAKFAEKDMILVDTPGRSQNDESIPQCLEDYLRSGRRNHFTDKSRQARNIFWKQQIVSKCSIIAVSS